MEKKDQLYEGKAKKVFATDDPELLIVSYKDDATAFNGLKKGTITGKGVINNRMSNFLMKKLEKEGVPTHFVEELNDRETLVKKVSIVPLEVIIRNISAGSFAKHYGVEEGIVFDEPTIEFSYKNDELGDPHHHADRDPDKRQPEKRKPAPFRPLPFSPGGKNHAENDRADPELGENDFYGRPEIQRAGREKLKRYDEKVVEKMHSRGRNRRPAFQREKGKQRAHAQLIRGLRGVHVEKRKQNSARETGFPRRKKGQPFCDDTAESDFFRDRRKKTHADNGQYIICGRRRRKRDLRIAIPRRFSEKGDKQRIERRQPEEHAEKNQRGGKPRSFVGHFAKSADVVGSDELHKQKTEKKDRRRGHEKRKDPVTVRLRQLVHSVAAPGHPRDHGGNEYGNEDQKKGEKAEIHSARLVITIDISR